MCTKTGSPAGSDEELREYLMQDLAMSKLLLKESRRSAGKLLCLVIVLVLLFIVCAGGFAATVFFVTKEHTRQFEALCRAGLETTTTVEREHVLQEGVSGGAVINNRSSISNSTVTNQR